MNIGDRVKIVAPFPGAHYQTRHYVGRHGTVTSIVQNGTRHSYFRVEIDGRPGDDYGDPGSWDCWLHQPNVEPAPGAPVPPATYQELAELHRKRAEAWKAAAAALAHYTDSPDLLDIGGERSASFPELAAARELDKAAGMA